MNLNICKLHPDAITPTYGSEGAACFDLYALSVNGACAIGDGFEITREKALLYAKSLLRPEIIDVTEP